MTQPNKFQSTLSIPDRIVEIPYICLFDIGRPSITNANKFKFVSPIRIVEIDYSSVVPSATFGDVRVTSDGSYRITSDGSFRAVSV